MSLYDRILQEGAEKGRVEGRVALLEKQLLLKFGELPTEVRSRLSQASPAEIDRWAERVLFASSVADLFSDTP